MSAQITDESLIQYAKLSKFDIMFSDQLDKYLVFIDGVSQGEGFNYPADAINSGHKLTD
ncbi:MAG: hypothetical protein U9N61_09800 [Euryarchaeota archaeon]|nr:hypothetical protein [Euryarchaeota archaeon]